MKSVNWADVVPADSEKENKEFEKITPGGYICCIKKVEDNEEYESLKIIMDIEEGEHANFGDRTYDATGYDFGYLKANRKYADSWQKSFKAFLVALEESNRRFYADKFTNDPKKLEGLLIGAVVGEEEYAGIDKATGKYVKKIRPRVASLVSIDKIEKGDFKIPELKPMSDYYKQKMEEDFAGGPTTGNDDLPF